MCQLCALWVSLLWFTAPLSTPAPYNTLLLLRYFVLLPLSGLTAYDSSSSTGRISRLGAGVRFKQRRCCCIGTHPHYLFVFAVRAISWPAPARCNIRSSLLGAAATCSCALPRCSEPFAVAAVDKYGIVVVVLCSSCFLQVVVVVVVWSLRDHWTRGAGSCAAPLSWSR